MSSNQAMWACHYTFLSLTPNKKAKLQAQLFEKVKGLKCFLYITIGVRYYQKREGG